MRKITLFGFLYLSSILSYAQNIDENYIDGQIYVKIKQTEPIPTFHDENGIVNPLETPLFRSLVDEYEITKIQLTFFRSDSEVMRRFYRVHFNQAEKIKHIIRDLENNARVEYAEAIPLYKPCYTPDDPKFSQAMYLSQIKAKEAWDIGKGSANVVIGITDTDVNQGHEDLQEAFWTNPGEIAGNGVDDDANGYVDDIHGWDVASNDANTTASDQTQHGTHVAGLAGAATDNNLGVSSIGFNSSIMCVKVSTSPSNVAYAAEGVVYAADNGADVINMSWGGVGMSGAFKSAVDHAYNDKGCVLIAAAGNSGQESKFYPAAFSNVIGVANVKFGDTKNSTSQYGTWVDVSAPGTSVISTVGTSSYYSYTGTSMASPVVAGLAGLMKGMSPYLTQTQIYNCIINTADKIDSKNPGYEGKLGSGRINAQKAMQCVNQYTRIRSLENNKSWLVYPNPSSGLISFHSQDKTVNELNIDMTDMLGRKVFVKNNIPYNGRYDLDLSAFEKGIYLIRINDHAERIIIE